MHQDPPVHAVPKVSEGPKDRRGPDLAQKVLGDLPVLMDQWAMMARKVPGAQAVQPDLRALRGPLVHKVIPAMMDR